jgi:NAD dependent epimerase/dehydratase family enzyme
MFVATGVVGMHSPRYLTAAFNPVSLNVAVAAFIGTETELILKSRRVVPARLLERGFRFRFPLWQEAARPFSAMAIR